jgi:EAL and modified HD-GYP domain-containing signal transduction protein
MLATLVPLFDENLSVMAYSLFSQKANYLTDPIFSVSAQFDGVQFMDLRY